MPTPSSPAANKSCVSPTRRRVTRQRPRGVLDLGNWHVNQPLIEGTQCHAPVDPVNALTTKRGRLDGVNRPGRFRLLALELLLPVPRVPWDRLARHRRDRGAQTATIDSDAAEDRPLGDGTRYPPGADRRIVSADSQPQAPCPS